MTTGDIVLQAAIDSFRYDKALAERAIAQVPDKKMHEVLDSQTNSIVVIMKHIAGNLLSRWTDFLTTDGEKDWRNRDQEFVDDFQSRDELMAYWEKGWQCLFDTLESLTAADLNKTVKIRGVDHSVPMAISRSNAHIGYHVGQIVMIARIQVGDDWKTLTIDRGKSDEYNQQNWGKSG
jgi:hypothetical protein